MTCTDFSLANIIRCRSIFILFICIISLTINILRHWFRCALAKHHLVHSLQKQRLHRQTDAYEKIGIHVALFHQGSEHLCFHARVGSKPCHVTTLFLQNIAQEMPSMEFREAVEVFVTVHYIPIYLFNNILTHQEPLQSQIGAVHSNSWCKNRLSHYFTIRYDVTETIQMCNINDTFIPCQTPHRGFRNRV